MQFPAGYDDYLVESVEDCAAKTLRLLENRELAERFGRAGQEKIRAECKSLERWFFDSLILSSAALVFSGMAGSR